MDALRTTNEGVRFLLELAVLASLGYWGWKTGDDTATRPLFAIAGPLLAAALWGTLVAPRAPYRLEDPWRLGMEIVVFGGAVVALAAAGRAYWGVALALVAAANLVLLELGGHR